MEILSSINKKFIDLSVKVKIQLYLLSFLCIVLFFINLQKNESFTTKNPTFKSIYHHSSIDLINQIEKYTRQNKISISSIDSKDKVINIVLTGKMKKLNSFTNFIEYINSNSKITYFELYRKKKNLYELKIRIDFKTTYLKKSKNIKIKMSKKKILPKVEGIIDNYAFLEKKWRKVGDTFSSYKILKIDTNSVTLKKSSKEFIIKVYHENDFK